MLAMGLLSPYRVLDLTDERGLLAGKIMADLGADVIQVEPPGGSSARECGPFLRDGAEAGRSLYWEAYACNKRSITCDLDSEEGQHLLRRLCSSADFLFESEVPGVMARRGLSYEALSKLNPHLIYVTITPFGSVGPKSSYVDSEIVVWAAGAALYANRDGDRPPLRISVPQAYLHAAADAAGGALVAHFARLHSGLGQHVEVSAQESVGQATLSGILGAAVGDLSYERHAQGVRRKNVIDQSGSGSALRRSKWLVQDGYVEMHLTMGPSAGRFTNNLMAWMRETGVLDGGTEELDWIRLPDQLRAGDVPYSVVEHAYELVAAFLHPYAKRTLADIAMQRKLLLAPIYTTADLAESPHLAARNFWLDVRRSDGHTRRLPGAFARTNIDAFSFKRAAPRPGEHSQAIEQELNGSSIEDQRPHAGRKETRSLEQPLQELKVLDLSWVVAGPAIGRVLADYGAMVVHVESGTRIETARVVGPFHGGKLGAENSAIYGNVNAGKLGLALDLSSEEARFIVRDLVRWADVVIEAFSPGVMKRWGLDYESLCQIKPEVIMLSTSLMGGTGPYSTFAGFGNVGAAMSGFQNIVGWPDRPPWGPFGPYTDYVGPRFGLALLLAALDHRRRTGEGCNIDLSQAEAGIHFLAPQMLDYFEQGHITERMGNRDPQMSPHGVYPCRDREDGLAAWVAIAVRDDDDWRRLATVMGGEEMARDPHFATSADRLQEVETLDEVVSAWARTRTALEAEATLQAAGIPAHNVATSDDALADPQLRFLGHFIELEHPLHGKAIVEASRYHLSRTPARTIRSAPTIGRDKDYILREILHYDEARVTALESAGVLK
jgi:crotonobetainyl-CoA:carnitine CoA-transferase CaiB-like acyl-CoA transferase